MSFLSPPKIEIDETPVPEPADDTARRAAFDVRRRRSRGGRARTILEGTQPPSTQAQAQANAPQPASTSLFGPTRGRNSLIFGQTNQ